VTSGAKMIMVVVMFGFKMSNELGAFSEYDTQKFYSKLTGYIERVGDI
jgi:hypothetical protein